MIAAVESGGGYSQQRLASEASILDGVTLPGGAAIAYAVQGTNGVDIVAAFYDATLDFWSLPRQLTQDEDVKSALSLAFDFSFRWAVPGDFID